MPFPLAIRGIFFGEKKMMISSISNSFFELCSFDKELLHNTNGRPHLVILKLIYRGKRQDFAILRCFYVFTLSR